ncbi:MAG TPA: type III-A CRISPR-associated protein Cas10/Csm1, partial [Calditrichaeota bacterium]|nr:type III-A CRISPR-associated protein Cas10/Csm1 [Calditrichota bacterium]
MHLEDGMIELTDQRKARLLGSLLHDIGKFQYRAEKTNVSHSENSAYFIREFLGRIDVVKSILEKSLVFAADHHKEYADDFLRQADGLSASERVKDDHYFAHRPLLSIFRKLDIGKGSTPSESWYVEPRALNIDDIFPEKVDVEPSEWKPDVKTMREKHLDSWEKMKEEFLKIPKKVSFESLYDTIYYLLERWTSRVCSAGYGFMPDISLFDHSRTVAAYADCLAESTDKDKPFLVIEGDISGIQNFIYKIANPSDADQKRTSKILRGRSLYVNLLSDTAADFILKELGLFKVHLLMNGGGHFHILSPNRENIRKKIIELEKRINKWLIKEHHGELGIVIASNEFSIDEVSDYSSVKRKMSSKLNQKKEKKNFDLIGEFNFFGPHEPGYTKEIWDVCKVCGGDMKKTKNRICPVCSSH